MTTPFLGEIQLFGFNFAPVNWSQCNGATMPISQYSTLYALLGTLYGGNGTSTFQLPNFASRSACGQGQGPGLTQRQVGDAFGEANVTLVGSQMPSHTHALSIYAQTDSTKRSGTPAAGNALGSPGRASPFQHAGTPTTNFALDMVSQAGGSQPHANQQPFLGVNFCIALDGVFPSFG